jgi:hypothetical protein
MPVQNHHKQSSPKTPAHNNPHSLFSILPSMPPPKHNPSPYTPKKLKPNNSSIDAFKKGNKKFGTERAKERNFQLACCTTDDDLSEMFGKMSVNDNNPTKKKK